MKNSELEEILREVLAHIGRKEFSRDKNVDLEVLLKVFEEEVVTRSKEKVFAWEPIVFSVADSLSLEGSEAVFTLHNRIGFWGTDRESQSGFGSSHKATKVVRRRLLPLLEKFEIKRLLDAPCGDFHWASLVDWSGIEYTGLDIDRSVIEKNSQHFRTANVNFLAGDLAKTKLENYDAVLCRDCLFHLPSKMAKEVLFNFRNSGIKYLISTYFPEQKQNGEIDLGGWYPINLCISPFKLPPPIEHFVDDPLPLVRLVGNPVLGGAAWRLLDLRSRLLTGKPSRPMRFLGIWDLREIDHLS